MRRNPARYDVLSDFFFYRACRAAMAFLKNGGSATDGVEMALKSLEDNEITNSGYGSNLSIDGSVECDASIMEDSGRSGAVGAVWGNN